MSCLKYGFTLPHRISINFLKQTCCNIWKNLCSIVIITKSFVFSHCRPVTTMTLLILGLLPEQPQARFSEEGNMYFFLIETWTIFFFFALNLKQNICPLKRNNRITWKTKQPSTYFWHVLLPAKKRQLPSMWQDPRPHVQGRRQRHRTSKGVSAASSERKRQRPEEMSPWAINWITPPVLKYVPVCRSRFSLWMWGFTRNTTLQPIWLWF